MIFTNLHELIPSWKCKEFHSLSDQSLHHFNLKLKLLWMLSTHEPSNYESAITLFQSMIATTKKRIILWSWFYLPFAGAKYTRIQTRYKLHQLVVIFFYDSCHIKRMLFVVVIKSMPCFRLSLHAHFRIYWNRLSFCSPIEDDLLSMLLKERLLNFPCGGSKVETIKNSFYCHQLPIFMSGYSLVMSVPSLHGRL